MLMFALILNLYYNLELEPQFLKTFEYFDFVTPKTHFASLLIEFHHNIFVILFFILGALIYLIFITVYLYSIKENRYINRSFFSFNFFKHKGMVLEIIWTIFPAVVLFLIAIPSFVLLYSTVIFIDPEFTFKAIGHQWYWKYSILQDPLKLSNQFTHEAYLYKVTNLSLNYPRATLTDDFGVRVPVNTDIRCLVTSYDVLHSWAIPSLGIKIDACPGRLNDVTFNVSVVGLAVGACSEICGVNHAFMPTALFVYESCAI